MYSLHPYSEEEISVFQRLLLRIARVGENHTFKEISIVSSTYNHCTCKLCIHSKISSSLTVTNALCFQPYKYRKRLTVNRRHVFSVAIAAKGAISHAPLYLFQAPSKGTMYRW